MPKSPDAFRTISEVADWLGIQAHVLRFWESKFTQVKPIKRAGGRRYYRPNDMLLLGGIRQLLHEDGLTIKGVQKILREEGMSHVASMSQPLDELTQSQVDDVVDAPMQVVSEPEQETGVVLNFEPAQTKDAEQSDIIDAVVEEPVVEMEPAPEAPMAEDVSTQPEFDLMPEDTAETVEEEPAEIAATEIETAAKDIAEDIAAETPEEEAAATLPAFLRRPISEPSEVSDNPPAEPEAAEPEPAMPKPRVIDMPAITPMDQIAASPALLASAFRTRSLTKSQAKDIAPLLDRLTVLRDAMAAGRGQAGQDAPDI